MKIITKNLNEASYLHSQGLKVERLHGDKSAVIFEFEGTEDALFLKSQYEHDQARANVKTLEKSMKQIKDMMFAFLRGQQVTVSRS